MKYPWVHLLCTSQSLRLQIFSEPSCWDPINAESADCQQTSFHNGENRKGFWSKEKYCHNSPPKSFLLPVQRRTSGKLWTPALPEPRWRCNMMDHASLLRSCARLDFCPRPKLLEFNLLSRVLLKSAQIIHPWNITALLSNVENSTRSYHTAVYSSMGRVVWGSVWDLSHLESSSAAFYKKFLTRRNMKFKKTLSETQGPSYSHV